MKKAEKLWLAAAVSAVFLSACSTTEIAPVTDRSSGVQGQTSVQAAPAEEPAAQAVPLSGGSGFNGASSGTYTVKSGDTLYRIARNHGVNVNELMRVNGITDPTQLAVGRTLTIPGAVQTAPAAAVQPVSAAAEPAAASSETAAAAESSQSSSSSAPVIPNTQERLVWPLKGTVAKTYTAQSRGIDIAAARGTDVAASASGEVLLTHQSFPGYGKLVILRHGDGTFVTAYGQLATIDVKKGDRVKSGQKIGTLQGENASNPALHFEVRIAGKPVDPMTYLR